MTKSWSATVFDNVDVANLEEKVGKYNKMVMRLERGLPSNKVNPEAASVALYISTMAKLRRDASCALTATLLNFRHASDFPLLL